MQLLRGLRELSSLRRDPLTAGDRWSGVGGVPVLGCVALVDDEIGFAQAHNIAGLHDHGLDDPFLVDVGAVGTIEVLDDQASHRGFEAQVTAGGSGIFDHDAIAITPNLNVAVEGYHPRGMPRFNHLDPVAAHRLPTAFLDRCTSTITVMLLGQPNR